MAELYAHSTEDWDRLSDMEGIVDGARWSPDAIRICTVRKEAVLDPVSVEFH
ncbi:MAG: hypothetical protein ACPGLY_23355 [Rubripirellula sp.]